MDLQTVNDSEAHEIPLDAVACTECKPSGTATACDNQTKLELHVSGKVNQTGPITVEAQDALTLNREASSGATFTHPKAADMIVASHRQKANPVLR